MLFVEPFAGTAAVSFHLVGSHRLTPYMGNKGNYAKTLVSLMDLKDVTSIIWNDAGPSGKALSMLGSSENLLKVATILEKLYSPDELNEGFGPSGRDRKLYDIFKELDTTKLAPAAFAAHWLFMQTRSFNGKPISIKPNGRWRTAGFDPEYRKAKKPGAKDRGWATPRWKLAEKVRQAAACNWPKTQSFNLDIRDFARSVHLQDAVIYVDPPYDGTTGYWNDCTRREIVWSALKWGRSNKVFFSEAEPIASLVEKGWIAFPLRAKNKTWARTKEEWITTNDMTALNRLIE